MLLLLACAGGASDDATALVDAAEYHYDGLTSIESVDATCEPPLVRVEVRTVGWSRDQSLRAVTAGSDETLAFPAEPEAWDPDGAWQVSVLETESACDPGFTAYHLVVTDPDGEEADCRVWGYEPDSLGTDCSPF